MQDSILGRTYRIYCGEDLLWANSTGFALRCFGYFKDPYG